MAKQKSPRPQSRPSPTHEGTGHETLVTRLGFRKVAEHIDELRLFYLIGCAYHDGAKSFRRIAAMLRTPAAERGVSDLRTRVGENLAKSLRAIHEAVAVVEDLAGERLVNRNGEGLCYDGFTDDGELLWGLTEQFAQELWG